MPADTWYNSSIFGWFCLAGAASGAAWALLRRVRWQHPTAKYSWATHPGGGKVCFFFFLMGFGGDGSSYLWHYHNDWENNPPAMTFGGPWIWPSARSGKTGFNRHIGVELGTSKMCGWFRPPEISMMVMIVGSLARWFGIDAYSIYPMENLNDFCSIGTDFHRCVSS